MAKFFENMKLNIFWFLSSVIFLICVISFDLSTQIIIVFWLLNIAFIWFSNTIYRKLAMEELKRRKFENVKEVDSQIKTTGRLWGKYRKNPEILSCFYKYKKISKAANFNMIFALIIILVALFK